MLTLQNPAGARLFLQATTWEIVATDTNGYVIPGTTFRGDTRDAVEDHLPRIEAEAHAHAAFWDQQVTDYRLLTKEYAGYDLRTAIETRLFDTDA